MFAQAAIQACSQTNPAEKGIYPEQAFLFISRLPDTSGVSSTLYSSALCIFHIDSPFMFYVAYASSGENSCVGAASSASLEDERERENSFQWRSRAECQTQRAAVPASKQEPQTKACLCCYITIIHGDNTYIPRTLPQR